MIIVGTQGVSRAVPRARVRGRRYLLPDRADAEGLHPRRSCHWCQSIILTHAWISGGRVYSPVCQSKFWFRGQTIDFRSTLALLGWPKTMVKVPVDMVDSDERILTGNMISPPVIGGVFLAVAAVLGKRPDQ